MNAKEIVDKLETEEQKFVDSKSDTTEEEQKPDEYDFPCLKMAKMILTKECKVSISDPKIQDDGFFS